MQTKTIKQKMRSVQNIGKITKAMEMISVSKMKKSVQKRTASQSFADRSFELLENLHVHKNLTHPYLETRKGNKILLVIIASNKGLCGGYNMNVSKQVTQFKNEHTNFTIDAIAVGKQSEKIARRNDINVIASFNELSDYYTSGEVRSVLKTITDTYDNDDNYQSVVVAYTQFVSSLSFDATVTPFIPLKVDVAQKLAHIEADTNSKRKFALYSFEPDEQSVLNAAVPAVLMTVIYQLLLESLASEHSARVMAMRNASDNASDMYDELKLNFNRARQAAITQEISEIVGGSSAVS
ncbi:ATP synthase F1 subunit gamma [Candidatus Campbellbacteria bacterium]|nr:ATP synthase F1 subunit gamma [Candidatus Campbellbacteria bacterium]